MFVGIIQHCKSMFSCSLISDPDPGWNPDLDPDQGFYAEPDMEFNGGFTHRIKFVYTNCAADFSLLNLPKGKSLGRSKPATNS